MADEGNVAVAEPETIAPVIEESVTEPVVEEPTAEAESAQEAEPVSKWAGKADDEIEAAIEAARKDTEARARQSERDKVSSEYARRQVAASVDYVTKGGITADLNAIGKAVLNGDVNVIDEAGNLKPHIGQTIINRAYDALADSALQGHKSLIGDLLNGAKLTQDELNVVENLELKMKQVDPRTRLPLATHDDVIKTLTEQVIQARIKAAEAGIIANYVKEHDKTAKARSEVGALKTADAARTASMRPTNGNGGTSGEVHVTRESLKKMSSQETYELMKTPAGQLAVERALSGR